MCLQRQVVKLAIRLFYCWSLLRNKQGKNLQNFASATVTVADVLPHVTVERKDLATLAGIEEMTDRRSGY